MYKQTFSLVASATLVASCWGEILSLEGVVVSATQTEQSLKNTTSDIRIISSEELESHHITSVLEALRTLGSMPIAQSGGLGQQSSFFQRGFGSENTVVLIDGIRYNDPTTTKGQSQLEHIMVNTIERIEIISGAQSGIWGANAAAGVINIITKKATNTLELGGKLEVGSYATTKFGATLSQKTGDFSYLLAAHQISSDGFSAQTPRGKDPQAYENDSYKNQTFSAKLGYEISPSQEVRAEFNFIDAKADYDGYGQPDANANHLHQINRLGSFGYRYAVNSGDYVDVTYALSAFDKKDPTGYTKVFQGINKELNILGTLHYGVGGSVVLGANTLSSRDQIRDKELDSKGIFVTNTNQWGALLITESLRHDKYDEFKDKTTGKIGLKYRFNDDISLSTNYGTAYRTPSLYELYASYYGNPELEPETTRSFDATVQYKHLSFTYYNNLIDDLIGFDPLTYINEQVSGTSRIQGYEVRYNNTLTDTLAMELTYNRLRAKDKEGQYLIRRPRENLTGSLTYYPSPKLSVGAMINVVGERSDTDYNTYPSTSVQTGRYTLVSATLNYDLSEQIACYLKGENLADQRYQEVEGYATAGRSVYAGLSVRF